MISEAQFHTVSGTKTQLFQPLRTSKEQEMHRAHVLWILLLGSLLSACSSPAKEPASTPQVSPLTESATGAPNSNSDLRVDPTRSDLKASTWVAGDHFLKSFDKGEAGGIKERFFLAVLNDLTYPLPYFQEAHPKEEVSVSELLNFSPVWYQQVFPDGTHLRIHDLAEGPIEEPGVMNLRLVHGKLEGFLIYPDESRRRFQLSSEFPPVPSISGSDYSRGTAALFATQMLFKDFTSVHGRFPASFEEMCEWRRVIPGPCMKPITDTSTASVREGFILEQNSASLQTRSKVTSLSAEPIFRFATFTAKYRGSEGFMSSTPESLKVGDSRINAPNFQMFLAAELLPAPE